MMKKAICFLLALLMILPSAAAQEFEASDWAAESIEKAIELDLVPDSPGDCRYPITRGSFAAYAATLLAVLYGADLDQYRRALCYRGWKETGEPTYCSVQDVANQLGILLGRGDGDYDENSFITRQEAAAMLARTYRAYAGEFTEELAPTTFADEEGIADWAMDDVQLMNHLGIMTGVGYGLFDPLGNYTKEQCLVTLVRLYDGAPNDEKKTENPFVITNLEKVIATEVSAHDFQFAFETEAYYVLGSTYWSGGMTPPKHHIYVISQDFICRNYRVPLVTASNSYYGDYDAVPENPLLSEDGTKLIYTVTIPADVYPTDKDGNPEPLRHEKGLYTVTMDLATGEQTYTRADLP